MRTGLVAVLIVLGVVACGESDRPPPHLLSLIIEPADAMVTVVDGKPVTQDYQVLALDSHGKTSDVTDLAVLTVDERWGTFAGATFTASGLGAGKTKVMASLETVQGVADLTIFVKRVLIDPDVPPTTPGDFDNATEDPALAPTIRYPLDKILVPPNLGTFEVHWQTRASTIFELRMGNTYVDIRRYTKGIANPSAPEPYWSAFEVSEWSPIASTKQRLSLKVAGMSPQMPGKKGTSTEQAVDVTNENTRGGIYYWASASPASVLRYDVAKPSVPPARVFAQGQVPGGGDTCHGCHTMSRDGTKLAMTLDGGDGRGTAIDLVNGQQTIAVNTAMRWNFATFSPDGAKLLTVYRGAMTLRSTAGGNVLLTLPNAANRFATHPEISPDGTKLVNAECAVQNDAFPSGCGLVLRSLDLTANTAGTARTLVAFEQGKEAYYPSFSPDGTWIAFTRSTGGAYNIASAETWVVKSDGSAPAIKLTVADKDQAGRTNSWARWVPFAQTFGARADTMFYLTFSSMRPFGVRLPAGGRPQIWMTPFFPARALAGEDPSGAAFRLPFQNINSGNHIAQWTQAIISQ